VPPTGSNLTLRVHRLRPGRSAALALGALLGVTAVACAGWSEQPSVARLPEPAGPAPVLPAPAPTTAPATTSATSSTVPPPAGGRTGADRDLPTPVAGSATEVDRIVIQGLLDRYDRALTDLAAAPDAADDPSGPLLRAWHEVVPAGSELDESVLDRIRGRRAGGLLVEPVQPGDLSYVHRVVEVVRTPGPVGPEPTREELVFTWCGWSPGLGRRVDDGAGGPGPVVDDAVAHSLGTGRVTRPGPDTDWVVASLLESELTLLPPGSADPCG